MVARSNELRASLRNPRLGEVEKKKMVMEFVLEFSQLFLSEAAKDFGKDVLLTINDSNYAQLTRNLEAAGEIANAIGWITGFYKFAENWAESYGRAQSGELDSVEAFTAEVTALSFNTAKDLSASMVLTLTTPAKYVIPGSENDRETFRQVMSHDVTRQDVRALVDWIIGKVSGGR
jgi:hypothetical protein